MDTPDNELIPTADAGYVRRLRRILADNSDLNKLEKVEESTDMQLYEALQDAMDEFIATPPDSVTVMSFKDIPWAILSLGAVLNVLSTQGILSARNTLTYQDAGGVTVQDYDKYGRYINYFNVLINKYYRALAAYKLSKNMSNCYGGVSSEYSLISGWEY